ncbi:MAG: DUF4352 domain-containing protein [Firmicutes bacterium]|nr:DUF4352 domain-containing protein [Bacillota bacterium]
MRMKPGKINTLKAAAFVLTLMLALGVFAGCGQDVKPKAENGSPKSPASGQAEKPALKVGEAGKTDKLSITVTKAEKAKEWVNSPAKGREYVVVSFKVTNISKEEQSIGANDFQYVSDESGSREAYARTTGVKAVPDTFGAAKIAPGDTFEGSLVYAVPVEMSRVELHYMEKLGLKPDLRFEFNK